MSNLMKRQTENEYRLIAFDLDGTILDGDHQVVEKNN